MEEEKGKGKRREKHIEWFLLLFIGVTHFNKKCLSFMSKYPSKSVQVLIVGEMPSSQSLLSTYIFRFHVSICPQPPRQCFQLSTFSSACFYFSYLAQFQFTDSQSPVTASSTVNQDQAMELNRTSQGSRKP